MKKDIEYCDGYTIETLVPKRENQEDSFWYRDDSLAVVQFPNGNKLYADACGEIRVQFEIDGEVYRNHKAVEKAEELNFVDADLDRIGMLFDAFGNNNWFAIREYDIHGECSQSDLGIAHTYDEAMELLRVVAKEKRKEYYT